MRFIPGSHREHKIFAHHFEHHRRGPGRFEPGPRYSAAARADFTARCLPGAWFRGESFVQTPHGTGITYHASEQFLQSQQRKNQGRRRLAAWLFEPGAVFTARQGPVGTQRFYPGACSRMKTIGFIGVGELALYTIKGVRRGGYQGPILLSPRNHGKAEYLAAHHQCQVQPDNQSVVANSDYIVIATRPAHCLETLDSLEFKAGQVLISVVAGIEVEELRAVLPAQLEIVRAMPVSSAEASASPTLIYPDHQFVREFFDYCGNTIAVDNEVYFTQGSILACVYCWFFSLYEELIQSTQGPALPAGLSAELVIGMGIGRAHV